MAAGATYEPIATTTLGSAQASVTFSSISSSYTDIILICRHATNVGGNTFLRFNGDSGSNYSVTFLRADGSTASSARGSNESQVTLESFGFPTPDFGAITTAHIMNYSNSTTFKTVLSRGSNANSGSGVSAVVNLWRDTAAINSITISSSASTFSTNSVFTIYGIKAA